MRTRDIAIVLMILALPQGSVKMYGKPVSKSGTVKSGTSVWTERILNSDGTINLTEYKNVATHAGELAQRVCFAPSVGMVSIRVGISYVSAATALENLNHEIPCWDFEKVRKDARAAWNDALGHVQVKGGEEKDRKVFYTALYHALIYPSVFSDVNSEYMGLDGKVHKDGGHNQYTNFSGWDTYRSQMRLLAMLFPGDAGDMAQSLVRDAEQGVGGLPHFVWADAAFQGMVGDPPSLILAGLYGFGAREFDTKTALATMLRGANDPKIRYGLALARPYLEEYLQKGYVTGSGKRIYGAASITLEYQNADFAISRLAKALGDSANERSFLIRSAQWRKIFDSETRYIRPRAPDGSFVPSFTPSSEAGFVEGNSAHYTWMIPYDLAGLVAAVGETKAAKERLDSYFSKYMAMYQTNNIQGVGKCFYKEVQSDPEAGADLLYRQKEYVKEITRRLNDFDNVIYEIADEPWGRNDGKWLLGLIDAFLSIDGTTTYPVKHLLGQTVGKALGGEVASQNANSLAGDLRINWFPSEYVAPVLYTLDNFTGYNKPIMCIESCYWPSWYPSTNDMKVHAVRIEEWEQIVGGAAGHITLNADFTRSNPAAEPPCQFNDGDLTWTMLNPQKKLLKDFMYSFDFTKMIRNTAFIVTGDAKAHGISGNGQYALYIHHSSLPKKDWVSGYNVNVGNYNEVVTLNNIPAGKYKAEWISPETGGRLKNQAINQTDIGNLALTSPDYSIDIAFRMELISQSNNSDPRKK
jgi:hypothetical protein